MTSPTHDDSHIRRVRALALKIAEIEGADVQIVDAAARLHDMQRKEGAEQRDHAEEAADLAAEVLEAEGFPADKIPAVQAAIASHRYSRGPEPDSLEAKCIADADRLDAIGAIGVLRACAYSAGTSRAAYHGEDPFGETDRALEDDKYLLDHFYTKLLRIRDRLYTKTAKQFADERHAFMESFLAQLGREIGR